MIRTPSYPRSAYVHIPFCVSKCYYCDFESFAGLQDLFDDYVRALILEIESSVQAGEQGLETVYFGGGTPTLFAARDLASVLGALDRRFGTLPEAEITIEANPGTVDALSLAEIRATGFNRLSLGVQSFDDGMLTRIGRAHTSREALAAYKSARSAGFENIGIDLIFALPGQSADLWQDTLDQAVGLSPEHISLYELTIEHGTRLAQMRAEGLLDLPDEDSKLRMYEAAIETLASAGYEHYEVSNFARPGFRSKHNQAYWRNEPCYGFGSGATSYIAGTRAHRLSDPTEYIERVLSGGNPVDNAEQLTGRARAAETLVLGLRMLDGVDIDRVQAQTGIDVLNEFSKEIAELVERGLVVLVDRHLKVTHRGLLLLDDVAQEFL
ncbi:MAG: radical SAM family heme chaperone HemW [Armatimonadota bacterium]